MRVPLIKIIFLTILSALCTAASAQGKPQTADLCLGAENCREVTVIRCGLVGAAAKMEILVDREVVAVMPGCSSVTVKLPPGVRSVGMAFASFGVREEMLDRIKLDENQTTESGVYYDVASVFSWSANKSFVFEQATKADWQRTTAMQNYAPATLLADNIETLARSFKQKTVAGTPGAKTNTTQATTDQAKELEIERLKAELAAARGNAQSSDGKSDKTKISITSAQQIHGQVANNGNASAALNQLLNRTPATSSPVSSPSSAVMAMRKALVIGNDSYASVTPLQNARGDAIAIANGLKGVGYSVTLVTDATRSSMNAAIRRFKSQLAGGDEVVIFYAGHAVQIQNVNYLLPIDIAAKSEDGIKDDAVELQRILDDVSSQKAKFTVAVVDACRDNPFQTVNGRSIGGTRGLSPTTAATGQMIVFSAGTGQQALDNLGDSDKEKNGVFTRVFLKHLKRPGVSIDQMVRDVREEVFTLAKSIGHDQVPAVYDQVVGRFYFVK
jgi:hypothetical protein